MKTKRMLLVQVDERLGLMLAIDAPIGKLTPQTVAKVAQWSDESSSIKAIGMISVEVEEAGPLGAALLAIERIQHYMAQDYSDNGKVALIAETLLAYGQTQP